MEKKEWRKGSKIGYAILELLIENKRYREALEKISDMHRLTHSVTDAIDVANKALEGGKQDG